jgi:hypothetical protein
MGKRYTNPTNIGGMAEVQTEYFASTVQKNGRDLEKRAEQYLLSNNIKFQPGGNRNIDFIIDGEIHMDCVATSQSGSIDDKIPTKCFKYIKKYNLFGKEIYILHPYSPIEPHIAEHLEHLENTMDTQIHLLDWNDFLYICNGGRFEIRKPYNIVVAGKGIKNHKPSITKINKFFKF